MTGISTVPMRTKDSSRHVGLRCWGGFTLLETLLVVGLIGLMAGTAFFGYSAMWGNFRFKREVQSLVDVLQMAQDAAAQSDRRYEVVLDRELQGYIFREFIGFTSLEDEMPLEDPEVEAIQKTFFSQAVFLDSIDYDYLTQQEEEEIRAGRDRFFRFVTGRPGWQAGGKIVLLDEHDRPWTIVVHRFAKPVELVEGDEPLWLPLEEKDVPF